MAGLLGDFLSWIDSQKRIVGDNVHGLLTDPMARLDRAGYQAVDQLAPFVDAAARGDIAGTATGLLNNGVGGLLSIKIPPGASPQRVKRRVGTTGQYVGAPPGVDSPQKLGQTVKEYMDAMESGYPGRDFYRSSSADIWNRTGHDPVLSDQVAGNLALLSRSNNVAGNTTMSAKGHVQAMTGEPVHTGRFPSKDSGPVADLYSMDARTFAGYKRDPFAQQLGVQWAPERIGRGVNDMHEAELMGYPSGKVAGETQHAYMDEIRQRAINLANERKLGGASDWDTGAAQAAAWTGNKIRRGEVAPGDAAKDYAYYLPRMEANATYESFPGVGTGHLPNAPAEDFAAKLAFHNDPRGAWNTSPSGRDVGYTATGLLPGAEVQAVGRFGNEVNPATVARPVAAQVTTPMGPALTRGSQDAMNLVEGSRAYFDAQNAGAWHKVMPSKAPERSAAFVPVSNMDEAAMKTLAPYFEKKGYWIASAPEGITVMANEGTPKGLVFTKDVNEIMKASGLKGSPEFGRLESGFVDYSSQWGAAPGSVTKSLLDLVAKAPKSAGLLEQSSGYKAAVVARNERDLAAQAKGWGQARDDVLRAREIFSRDGWKGLEDAAKKGLVPAAAVAAVLGGGLLGDPQTQ